MFEYGPDHRGCILVDVTHHNDKPQDGTAKFFLRSEILACVTLLRRQMNEVLWDDREDKFHGRKLDVKDRPIKVSVLKIIQGRG